MTNLDHEEIRKREILKELLSNELFEQAMQDVRREMGDQMLRTNDATERQQLYNEAMVMRRLEGKLNEYAAELLFLKKNEAA